MAQEQTTDLQSPSWPDVVHVVLTVAIVAVGFSLALTLVTIGWSDFRGGLTFGLGIGGLVSSLSGLAQIYGR